MIVRRAVHSKTLLYLLDGLSNNSESVKLGHAVNKSLLLALVESLGDQSLLQVGQRLGRNDQFLALDNIVHVGSLLRHADKTHTFCDYMLWSEIVLCGTS